MKRGERVVDGTLEVKSRKIEEFIEQNAKTPYQVNRRYQRKLVWNLKEKQDFIDTLMRGYPIPLILLASYSIDNVSYYEIIDGLQRLEAILAFVTGKFQIKYDDNEGYFNLETLLTKDNYESLSNLEQKTPVLPVKLCKDFLRYELPVSVAGLAESQIDDVFKRINASGRKLSKQDLRQAGSLGMFGDLVRTTSSYVRGDYTNEDNIALNDMQTYSLNSKGLNYGIDTRNVFWVEQGIINESGLRRSKDEEIIAIIYDYVINGTTAGTSSDSLDKIYKTDSEFLQKQCKEQGIENTKFFYMELFAKTLGILNKILEGTTFSKWFFNTTKNSNKDYTFIVLFIAILETIREGREFCNIEALKKDTKCLMNNEMSEIIAESQCVWNPNVRNKLVDRVKHKLSSYTVDNKSFYDSGNVLIDSILDSAKKEHQMLDFKMGLTNLEKKEFQVKTLNKIIRTLTAMANTKPGEKAYVILGVADNDKSAEDFQRHYNATLTYSKGYKITGVLDEANRYYTSIDNYVQKIVNHIEKAPISEEVIQQILANKMVYEYRDKIVLVLSCVANENPIFYDKKLYVRHDSNDHEVENGSPAYLEKMKEFYQKQPVRMF